MYDPQQLLTAACERIPCANIGGQNGRWFLSSCYHLGARDSESLAWCSRLAVMCFCSGRQQLSFLSCPLFLSPSSLPSLALLSFLGFAFGFGSCSIWWCLQLPAVLLLVAVVAAVGQVDSHHPDSHGSQQVPYQCHDSY